MNQRNGYTTVELIASLISAVALMAGLATAVSISGRALQSSPTESETIVLPGTGLAMWQEDISDATDIRAISGQTVTIEVPDRNGDSVNELVTYAVVDRTLQRTENSGAATAIADSVDAVAIAGSSRTITPGGTISSEPAGRVIVQSHVKTAFETASTSVDLKLPAGTGPGELVLMAIALDGNEVSSLAVSEAGWNLLQSIQQNGTTSIAVWYRVADGTESATRTISWTNGREGVAWALRVTGTGAYPIGQSTNYPGTMQWYHFLYGYVGPSAPETYLSYPGLVIQFAAFEGWQFNLNTIGLSNHTVEFTQSNKSSGWPTLQVACAYTDETVDWGNRFRLANSGDFTIVSVAVLADMSSLMGGP